MEHKRTVSFAPEVESKQASPSPSPAAPLPADLTSTYTAPQPTSSVSGAPPVLIKAAVPRLDDLIVKKLAENYDLYPAFDAIPVEYLETVVSLLDPSQITFHAAVKYIRSEVFWRRLCFERWVVCDIGKHGNSYKRMYVERHVQSLIEDHCPSGITSENEKRLREELNAARPFVQTLCLNKTAPNLDVYQSLGVFPNLSSVSLRFGASNVGMDYDVKLFGLHLTEAKSLSRWVRASPTLSVLRLPNNLLRDPTVAVICAGLSVNPTVTELDLSHNRLQDRAVGCFARLMSQSDCVLRVLNLEGNDIAVDGAMLFAQTLLRNRSCVSLNLSGNPLTDEGGAAILSAVKQVQGVSWSGAQPAGSSQDDDEKEEKGGPEVEPEEAVWCGLGEGLLHLQLADTGLGAASYRAFQGLMGPDLTLETCDLSGNEAFGDSDHGFGLLNRVRALRQPTLQDLQDTRNALQAPELRETPVNEAKETDKSGAGGSSTSGPTVQPVKYHRMTHLRLENTGVSKQHAAQMASLLHQSGKVLKQFRRKEFHKGWDQLQ